MQLPGNVHLHVHVGVVMSLGYSAFLLGECGRQTTLEGIMISLFPIPCYFVLAVLCMCTSLLVFERFLFMKPLILFFNTVCPQLSDLSFVQAQIVIKVVRCTTCDLQNVENL